MGVLRTALYCRLSKDDMAQGDSESIRTQKAMLTQYAREHNFLVVEVYVDDGWSGLNVDRPDLTVCWTTSKRAKLMWSSPRIYPGWAATI